MFGVALTLTVKEEKIVALQQSISISRIDYNSFDVESNFNNNFDDPKFLDGLITMKRFGSRMCEAGEGDCSRDSDCKGSLVRYNLQHSHGITWVDLFYFL